jgi:tRNA(Ile)-lysidine synthase
VSDSPLESAVATVPPGRWGVGVSVGADSVALLRLLMQRTNLSLHVIHLDHQTRGEQSASDAEFVRELAERSAVHITLARRDQIEPGAARLPRNASARYRALRLELFRCAAHDHGLQGVILAHHADDQAETILHRLVRGSSAAGLGGMSPQTRLGGLLVLRPLLSIWRRQLREYLLGLGQPWREDASNASAQYTRNRLRAMLADDPELCASLLNLGDACRDLRLWVRATAPRLPERFAASELARLPDVLARQAARQWLEDRGAAPNDLSDEILDRLLEMASDAATAPRAHFPGGIAVVRKARMIRVVAPPE